MKFSFIGKDFTPDMGNTDNPGMLDACNVLPHPMGFRPLKQLQIVDSASAGLTITEIAGAFSTLDQAGAPVCYAASQNQIWFQRVNNTTWTNKGSASMSAVAETGWVFSKFGKLVIATALGQTPQKSTLSSGNTGVFADLGGYTRTAGARFIAVVRDFVVFAYISGANGDDSSYTLVWSALGNAEDYTASATTQSDSQIIYDGGPIKGLVGGEYGLIFFENAIYRMTYIGAPVIFQFDKIYTAIDFQFSESTPVGTNYQHGYQTVRMGDAVYFVTRGGLGVVYAGQAVKMISLDKNDEYLLTTQRATEQCAQMLAADLTNQRIVFGYSPIGNGTLKAGNLWYYDVNLDRMTRATESAVFVFTGVGHNIASSLHPAAEFYFTDLNRLAVRGSISATNMAAFVETPDLQLLPEQNAFVNKVRPLVNGAGAPMVQVGTRQRHNQFSTSYSASITVNGDGVTPQRATGRLHRFKVHMSVAADWQTMTGIEINATPDGDR